MPEQLSFAEFAVAPVPAESVFLAILPDPEAAARLAQLAQHLRDKHGSKGRPLATKRFHISLHYVADHVPNNIVATARGPASRIAMPPFRIEFDHVKSFRGDRRTRPLVLCGGDGVVGLLRFQELLGVALQEAGLGRWTGPSWLPHLTLLYGDRDIKEEAIEPVSWTAHEFALLHSQLGRTQYTPLARWPLQG